MLCDSFLSLRDGKEKQEGSTLARPTDHDCSARPLFMGIWRFKAIRVQVIFVEKMALAQ
jgi:hypothetical protein